ncbi:MAG TPA: RNA-directed DNA polymerase [Myxococcota bacterium]|nr:RNA-directed DNA polymerase [Myxococcota bacterium]HNZ04807.1 RNA-directed DNA polymerase [Myxococcota bacterium]
MTIESAVHMAIENVRKEGLTDIFPRPFEVDMLNDRAFREKVADLVVRAIQAGDPTGVRPEPLGFVLLPKTSAFDFRRCALMQPLDTIRYLALALLMAEQIEAARPPKQDNVIFSYRFAPSPDTGLVFDQSYNITSFKKATSETARDPSVSIVVSCDIANFYDRLDAERLSPVLLSLGCDPSHVNLLMSILRTWRAAGAHGFPTGSNASRILAEAMLLGVDNHLASRGIRFCRFVDDFRLFAPDLKSAHLALTTLIHRLDIEGLAIKGVKTRIDPADMYGRKAARDEQPTDLQQAARPPLTPEQVEQFKEDRRRRKGFGPGVRIMAGYGGAIPSLFREVTERLQAQYRAADPAAILARVNEHRILSPEDALEYVRVTIYSARSQLLRHLPSVLDKFPQFIPLVVDGLIKHHKSIAPADLAHVRQALTAWADLPDLPEYLAVAIIRLNGAPGLRDPAALDRCLQTLCHHPGALIGRTALDTLTGTSDPAVLARLKTMWPTADPWERRQIARILVGALGKDGAREWIAGVERTEFVGSFGLDVSPDVFAHAMLA